MKHLCLCLLILGLLAPPAAAATTPLPPPPDSLKALLQQAKGPARLNVVLRVMDAFNRIRSLAALPYSQEAVRLAQAAHDTLRLGRAYKGMANHYMSHDQPEQAARYLTQATALWSRVPLSLNDQAELANDWGNLENERGRPAAAHAHFRQAQQYSHRQGDLIGEATTCINNAQSYLIQAKKDSFLFYTFKARQLHQGAGNKRGIASADLSLSEFYDLSSQFAEALRYGREALALQEEIHVDAAHQYGAWTFIGQALTHLKRPKEALRYLRRAYQVAQALPRMRVVARVTNQMVDNYLQLHQPDSARYVIDRALSVAQHLHDNIYLGELYTSQIQLYSQLRKWPEARQATLRALAAEKPGGSPNVAAQRTRLLITYNVAAHLAERLADYHWAYSLLHRRDSIQTLLEQGANEKLLAEMQVRLQTAEAEQKVVLLQKEARLAAQQRELAELRRRQQVLALALVAVLAVAALVGGLRYARQRQRRREESLRRKLAADLHDDVGSLLTRISLESSLLNEGLATPAEQHALRANLVGMSQQALRQMGDVVWSIDDHHDSLPALLNRMREHGYDLLPAAGLELDFEAAEAVAQANLSQAARQHLYLIYKEALHNAVKHAQGARTVRVRLAVEGRTLRLRVQDDGPGTANPSRADGHGLANMRRRAEAVGGRVQYDTAPGAGFAVNVELPLV